MSPTGLLIVGLTGHMGTPFLSPDVFWIWKDYKAVTLDHPLCGSFHEAWHDCCTVHMTFPGLCRVSGFWRVAIGVEKDHSVLLSSMGHNAGHFPNRHTLTRIAAWQCLYPLPLFSPLLFFSVCPLYFFSFQISSFTSVCELSTGECAWDVGRTTDPENLLSTRRGEDVLQLRSASRGTEIVFKARWLRIPSFFLLKYLVWPHTPLRVASERSVPPKSSGL